LVLAAFAIASCNSAGLEAVTVEVDLKNIPVQTKEAYLQEMQPAAVLTIDTATVEPVKGEFSFTFVPSGSEGLYRVRLDDSTDFLLALKNEDVKISGDYHHPESWEVSGSEASKELQHFLSQLNASNQALFRKTKEY